MNHIILLVGITALLTWPGYASPKPIRLSTLDSEVIALVGIANYAAIVVDGATPASRRLKLTAGPGEIVLDRRSRMWLWRWRPDSSVVGNTYHVTLRDEGADAECAFDVSVRTILKSGHIKRLESGVTHTGIELIGYSEQPGMNGRYEYRVYFDDSLAAVGSDPQFTFAADLQRDLGKEVRVKIEYTAPRTKKPVILGEYRARLAYPPLRAGGKDEVYAGEDLPIKAALGVAPNYYIPLPGRHLLVTSDGHFEDSATMVSYYDPPMDHEVYPQYERRRIRDTSEVLLPSYDFVLRQMGRTKDITEPAGVAVLVKLRDPSTGQETFMNVRIFPSPARLQNKSEPSGQDD